MKSDLVNIFNRLTSSELADCDLFSDILENHYEKFKYFYSLIEDINVSKIDRIYCKTNKNTLRIVIEPEDTSYINKIIYSINSNKDDYTFSKYFNLNLIESGDCLLVEIETKNNVKEEGIYENRSF
jgi:hypothetical protein